MSNPEVYAGTYPEEMDIYEARRLALQQLIDSRFDGNQRAFAADTGIAPSYVNRMLKLEGDTGRKRIGDDMATKIERLFDLPQGSILNAPPPVRRGAEEGLPRAATEAVPDRRHIPSQRGLIGAIALRVMDVEASVGHDVSLSGRDNVIMNMVVDEGWLRRNASFSSPENLALVTGIGDSMRPTFEDGDPLLVDRAVTEIKLDAIYVLALRGELFIKRIQRRPDGSFLMISDNRAYEPYHLADGERDQFQVLGRVVMAWNSRRI
jgi:phage repressor protein C with HTH and peptisase S24 domain